MRCDGSTSTIHTADVVVGRKVYRALIFWLQRAMHFISASEKGLRAIGECERETSIIIHVV